MHKEIFAMLEMLKRRPWWNDEKELRLLASIMRLRCASASAHPSLGIHSLITPFPACLTLFSHSQLFMQLMNILNLEWDTDGRHCLDTFRAIRDSLSAELGLPVDPAAVLQEFAARPPFPSHEIIVAEVSATRARLRDLSTGTDTRANVNE